jgi:hypothetical protein
LNVEFARPFGGLVRFIPRLVELHDPVAGARHVLSAGPLANLSRFLPASFDVLYGIGYLLVFVPQTLSLFQVVHV